MQYTPKQPKKQAPRPERPFPRRVKTPLQHLTPADRRRLEDQARAVILGDDRAKGGL